VLPANLGLPWTDPANQSPLEQLLASIASKIAGRPVTVRCEGDYDWSVLAAQNKFDPVAETGWVPSPPYYAATNRFVSSATMMELSPGVCLHLQQFAQAAIKPTKCQATTSEDVTVTRQRLVTRYRVVKVTKPTRINGRLHKVGIWKIPYQVKVPYTVTTTKDVLAPPAPCFLGTPYAEGASGVCWQVPDQTGVKQKSCFDVTANPDNPFWSEYSAYGFAIKTVAHEAIHLWQDQAGALVPADAIIEAQANCSGLQWMYDVATALGDTPDDAQAIATFEWLVEYPGAMLYGDSFAKQHPYWSADCKPGGALDIRGDKTGFCP
jgi:hypothetical protein